MAAVAKAKKGAGKMVAATNTRSTEPYCELMEITPELAAKWLEKNNGNRNLKKRQVDTIRRDILGGEWQIDGNTIRFSRSGRLLDGQHRLTGIVEAGVTVKAFVVFNLKDKSMEVIDRGAARSMGDLFKLNLAGTAAEMTNPRVYAGVVNALARLEQGNYTENLRVMSFGEAKAIFEKFEHDIRWAFDQVGMRLDIGSSGGAPVMAAFAFCRKLSKDKMEDFAYQFKNGEPRMGAHRMSSQARLLRAAVSNRKHSPGGVIIKRGSISAKTLRAIEAFLDNEEISILKVDEHVIERMTARRNKVR